jgi:hypothetical protein
MKKRGKKKAGEHSEEDTHRPAHHDLEVAAYRTFGRRTVKFAFPRERDAVEHVSVPQLDGSILTPPK